MSLTDTKTSYGLKLQQKEIYSGHWQECKRSKYCNRFAWREEDDFTGVSKDGLDKHLSELLT